MVQKRKRLSPGALLVSSEEDVDKNRTFIWRLPNGEFRRDVRCGQTGAWLTRDEVVSFPA